MSKTVFSIALEKKNPHDLVRHVWGFRPTERIVESKKSYNRNKAKAELRRALMDE